MSAIWTSTNIVPSLIMPLILKTNGHNLLRRAERVNVQKLSPGPLTDHIWIDVIQCAAILTLGLRVLVSLNCFRKGHVCADSYCIAWLAVRPFQGPPAPWQSSSFCWHWHSSSLTLVHFLQAASQILLSWDLSPVLSSKALDVHRSRI